MTQAPPMSVAMPLSWTYQRKSNMKTQDPGSYASSGMGRNCEPGRGVLSVSCALITEKQEDINQSITSCMAAASACGTSAWKSIAGAPGRRRVVPRIAGSGVSALSQRASSIASILTGSGAALAVFRDVPLRPSIKLYLCAVFYLVSGNFAAFAYIWPLLAHALPREIISRLFSSVRHGQLRSNRHRMRESRADYSFAKN